MLTLGVSSSASTLHLTTSDDLINTDVWSSYDTLSIDNDIRLDQQWTPVNISNKVINGNNHTISNIYINESAKEVGFFKKAISLVINDLTFDGEIINTRESIDNSNGNSTGLIAFVGEKDVDKRNLLSRQPTILHNVHSNMNITTYGPQSTVGGLVAWKSYENYKLYIEQSTFSGTITINSNQRPNAIGGLLGVGHYYDYIDNCLYDGSIIISSLRKKGTSSEGWHYDGNIGGIAGYMGKETNGGITNCLSAGYFDFGGIRFKNNGAIVGIIRTGTINDNNYFCNDTLTIGSREGRDNATSVNAECVSERDLISGYVCAHLNTDDVLWSQVLGYQLSGNYTPGSPCQRHPVLSTEHPVTDNDGDYVVDYFFFDDAGDDMVTPSDMTSMLVKRVLYFRNISSVVTGGVMAVCLPFDISTADGSMFSSTAYIYNYASAGDDGVVNLVCFKSISDDHVYAGTPVLLVKGENMSTWIINSYNKYIVPNPLNGFMSDHTKEEVVGVNGSFITSSLGPGYFKVNNSGTGLVYTTPSSHTYPYRSYIKIPDNIIMPGTASVSTFRKIEAVFMDDFETRVSTISVDNVDNTTYKTLEGSDIVIIKNNEKFDLQGKKK